MEPWYKVVTPRKEVREGRSFNPDEFAIALEQVVAGTAPEDYSNPVKFFSRTCFTRALREHMGMVLRRLAGRTENTAPVLMLITQFGGGKTHTLTAIYHAVRHGKELRNEEGIKNLLREAGLSEIPQAKVAVFVGNAWDPQEGHETPWIDIARQLAGNDGVSVLGKAAESVPPGTEALNRLFQVAGSSVVILFDEVLNFFNRHRGLADGFYAFMQNLTVAMTGTGRCSAVVSLPRSQMEMTDWDSRWQERLTKVIRRVAKDLIVADEAEVSEVLRKRLFEDIGNERVRKNVSRAYADWCFERRAQLPPEWTAVDTATTEAKAKEFLRFQFEACYPFHPATLSVFRRKWAALQQYQQTRGTLAMLAQWISREYQEGFRTARREPLITIGSAPLDVPEFRATVLGQLGETRLIHAIDADIVGNQSHTRALDADTKGLLRDIHRRVGTTILFESSGGQADKVAHLPELRFALGEPELDTTSIDSAAIELERKGFYLRKVGSDGFRFGYKPTLKKVVNDRRASLDPAEVKKEACNIVRKEFERGASVPLVCFPEDDTAIQDTPKLVVVIMSPEAEWDEEGAVRSRMAEWTRQRGKSPRLYPGSLIWCVKRQGHDLLEKVEILLAWRRVEKEIREGILGEFEHSERSEVKGKLDDAEEAVKDEVWAGYRFVALYDSKEANGLKVIDLGAGHASSSETLCGRIMATLKANHLLNESIGAGYIERSWPPALKESGIWPLSSLRQSFLNGALTRLLDPDTILRGKIVDFVGRGECGLASGKRPDGGYDRVWFSELVSPEEVVFDADVYLLTKEKAKRLKTPSESVGPVAPSKVETQPKPAVPETEVTTKEITGKKTVRISGNIPPELWNRLGTKLIPKLRASTDAKFGINFTVELDARSALAVEADIKQVLKDLNLQDICIEVK